MLAIERSQLPEPTDSLSAREEMLYYFILWCAAHHRPLPRHEAIARDFGFAERLSVTRAIWSMRELGLIERGNIPRLSAIA